MSEIIELTRADEGEVKALLDHLVAAFEQFLNDRNGEYDFYNDFMAVHNFHCIVVLDIERKAKLTPEQQIFWRKVAVDTFARAMENKPAWKQYNQPGNADEVAGGS